MIVGVIDQGIKKREIAEGIKYIGNGNFFK